jgi:C-terminal processing protease CtpA/Prc
VIPRFLWPLCLLAALTTGCNSLVPRSLPDEPPPLADMEISLADAEEPMDEEARLALDHGSFTGVGLGTPPRRRRGEEPEPGLQVSHVIENSPADAAGIRADDILIAVVAEDGEEVELFWPSQWNELEVETPPGAEIHVIYDRAGLEGTGRIVPVPRVHPRGRKKPERYREAEHLGVVLRTATEAEARSAGLGPGGGAVLIGMSERSPWRQAGLVFGDLIVKVNGVSVDHPQVVLDAVREGGDTMEVTWSRKGAIKTAVTARSERESEVSRVRIPVLFSYEHGRGDTEWAVLFGLLGFESTPAAYELQLLWLIHFGGGDADLLEEVDTP